MRPPAVLITLAAVVLACLLVAAVDAQKKKSYYEILGVKPDASQRDIKRAFREKAQTHHPDKNPNDPKAKEIFTEMANAYDVLSDDEKRRVYDQQGEEGLARHQQGGGGHDPMDIFGGLFGRRPKASSGLPKEENVEVPLVVTLADLYNGAEFEMAHRRQVLCGQCRGTGAKSFDDVATCPQCQGSGQESRTVQFGPGFYQKMMTQCTKCGGKGRIVKSTCPHCHGRKVEQGEDVITVVVERGMSAGDVITFSSQCDEHPDHEPGDLRFSIRVLDDPEWRRDGTNLHRYVTITLLDALVGFETSISHLDGHAVALKRTGVTPYGHVDRVTGEGMPHRGDSSTFGDLFVHYLVAFPSALTEEQRELARRLFSNFELKQEL